ncbi:hypothetical protein MMC12_007550 [Toensbergia leucococca]|nr:hypothetical protein [Toensbergia leucococca]
MPDVQHQIDQIVAKAKSVTPTHQVQFLNTYPPGSFVSPTAASFDGQPQHVQALCSAISILSTALDNSRSNAKACKDLMHVECESLLGIARVLHGGRGEVPSYVADLVNSVTILINLVQEQAKLMATLDLIKKEVKADLESVGLEGLLEDEVDE